MKKRRILAAILALVMALGVTTAIFAKDWSGMQTFDDVSKDKWYHGYVENLADQGIVSGYHGTRNFKPANELTRQEAAKMIAIAAGYKASADFETKFTDVKDLTWGQEYIYALEEGGVVHGFKGTNEFRPSQNVERSHVAKMVVLAFGLEAGDLDYVLSDIKGDDEEAYIHILASNGIVSGYQGTSLFKPDRMITRAEFAKVIVLGQATAAVQAAEAGKSPEAISKAKALVGNLPDDQDEAMRDSLQARLAALEEPEPTGPVEPTEPKVDKSKLSAKIAEAEALIEADYTQETWTGLTTALESAKTVNDNKNATQSQVDAALANLVLAMGALKPSPAITVVYTETIQGVVGKFSITVTNVEGAAYFRVVMYKSDGTATETKSTAIVDPVVGSYIAGDIIDIKILDASQTLLHRFDNVDVDVK